MSDELFPLVTETGEVIGSVKRCEAHGNPARIHPVVHCLVTSGDGRLLLQLRSQDKDVQPGRWDSSVGGHVGYGEPVDAALRREIAEEIGLDSAALELQFLYRYLNRSAIETELVHTYSCCHDGPFARQEDEIDELRFWTHDQIVDALGSGVFTPNFEHEYALFCRARA
jgi:isopentenyldiphosphate isomerase